MTTAEATPQLISDAGWRDLRARLDGARPGGYGTEDWSLGMPAGWLSELVADWSRFDPSQVQRRIDGLAHRFVTVGGQRLHVCLAAGEGSRPRPLLLTNGWPSSFLEYLELIPWLVERGSAAGDSGYDCFSLVIPALPGFGFSAAPAGPPMTGRDVARLWNTLMTETLGYERYVAHGTDLGAGVTAWLARDHASSLDGIHLGSPHLAPAREPHTPAESEFGRALATWTKFEGAYAHMHASKPSTVGAALLDSPAGLAAWIGEKFVAWSDTEPEPVFTRELLLATLTLYWSTGTIVTSMLPYWAHAHTKAILPIDDPSPVPTSVDVFGGERVPFPTPPRSLGERYFNIVNWCEHSTGGHFPAGSAPRALAGALREAFIAGAVA